MSAFICDDRVINRIVSRIVHNRCNLEHHFKRLGYDVCNKREDCERLAVDLFLMNCDAVDNRYGKGTAAHDVATCFQYKWEDCGLVQAYKHACCLRYQCSEGDVPNRPLFHALEGFIAQLADRIISALPEYETAQWDGHA